MQSSSYRGETDGVVEAASFGLKIHALASHLNFHGEDSKLAAVDYGGGKYIGKDEAFQFLGQPVSPDAV